MSSEVATQTAETPVTPESAPVSTTEPAPESAAAAPAETPEVGAPASEIIENEEGAKPSKAVRELIEQRKKRQRAEQEAAYWRGMAEARGSAAPASPGSAPSQPKPEPALVEPKLDNFETYEEYERANRDYLLALAEQRVLARQRQMQKMEQERTVKTTFDQRIETAANEDPEIISIMEDPTLPVSNDMVPVLHSSDVAPQLLKWLHNNRKEAARIASLPGILAAREMGLIEAQIKFAPKPAPPKRVSAAPEPIPTVAPTTSAIVDENSLPYAEWAARRNKAEFGR